MCQVTAIHHDTRANRLFADAGLDFDICQDGIAQLNGSFGGSAISITWSGGAGTFSNINDPLATYQPSAAEISTGTIALTITTDDPDGAGVTGPCLAIADNVTITINALPVVNIIQPASSQYAQSDLDIPLLASPSVPPGVWSGKGSLNGFYVPIAITIPDGEDFILDTLVYIYTDLVGCVNSDTKIIRIDKNPDIQFGAKPGQDYCENQGVINLFFDLKPNITTGTWAGNGIIDPVVGLFDPLLAGVNTHLITYTVVDPVTGGTTIASVTIRVHPKPVVDFIISSLCAVDSIQFLDATIVNKVFPEDSVVKWEWNFNNERFEKDQNPVMFFKDPGIKDITLSVKTLANNVGCVADTTITAAFGKAPIIDFDWSSICFKDSTLFVDNTVLAPGSQDFISQYNWNFGDGNIIQGAPGNTITNGNHPNGSVSFGTYEQPVHQFVDAARGDLFDVIVSVSTSAGCIDSLQQRVEILPSTALSLTQGYTEDFEQGRGGWFVEADETMPNVVESDTSWIWGIADGVRINSQNDPLRNNVWWTGANSDPGTQYTYLDNERSVVNGPCFDFRGIERPMVALDYFASSEENKDGTVFEYSLDGGIIWKTVGEKDRGIDWYNSRNIVSNPGQSNLGNGWTSDTVTTWRRARYTLPDEVIGEKKVRIRLYFAANADNADAVMNGFGFDNVFIGNKKRSVLAENFTSLNDATFDLVNNHLNTIQNSLKLKDIVYINYHISAGDPDQLNQDNDNAPRVRSGKYGLSTPIHTILDGSPNIPFGFSGLSLDPGFNSELVDSRSLIEPPLSIDNIVVESTNENIIEVSWQLSANMNFDRQLRIFTTVIEEDILMNSGSTAYNVVKKMMPDATGLSWNQNWQYNPNSGIGTVVDIASVLSVNNMVGESSLIWDINEDYVNIYDPDKLAVVVFIQDLETNEIYQVGYQKINDSKKANNITGIEDDLVGELRNINVYPNPVINDFHFVLDDRYVLSRDDYYWKLIDQHGITMLEGNLLFRNSRITISTDEVPNGLYHLIMGVEGKPMLYRKIAIMHR